MKKIMIIAAIVAVFCSCQKEDINIEITPEGIPVRVNFAGAGSAYDTRAFFDNTSEAEPWEKKIHRLILYVYNEKGNMIMYKNLTSAEINSLNGMVYLPESISGEECSIYAVANYEIPAAFVITTIRQIEERTATELPPYNPISFDAANSGSMQAKGFAMTGIAKITVLENATATITLRRVMAKVAIQFDTTKDFSQRYGGATIWVQYLRLYNVHERGYLFSDKGPSPSWSLFSTPYQNSGIADGISKNVFYIYEQGPCEAGMECYAIVTLTYDQDGNSTTTNDRITKNVNVTLQGSGNGEFKRNGYYRIKGTITDFDALHLDSAFTVEEWETPHSTDLGDLSM